MILVIDNYDSFTYNLVHYLIELGQDVQVHYNDQITVDQCLNLNPSHIVISPGPCTPDQSGISIALIQRMRNTTPILGVCLGHQALAQAHGARIVRAKQVMHGKVSRLNHNEHALFNGIPTDYNVTRYHSLVVDKGSLPEDFDTIATTVGDNEIMAIAHKKYPLYGVQFHPEAILTEHGHQLLYNFLLTRADPC